ncbi:uncharacterized protein LOC108630910 isoform X2 [Ceratina calcarata]|uniref:Uncharacterized protein LOC108630910 isoform X2 n=1 Tax=Ceratina calcarata TaxID=156304 RepID=A0AAJ7JD18_9HYME|nr:uncharacterized protein LOC108630910 isoform X2 [Ceratina calcarata]
MERFLNIDWNPPLEDMLENTFIDEERLEKETVMYKIITGNFTDPFKDIEADYEHVNIDSMKGDIPDLNDHESTEETEMEIEESKQPVSKQPKISKHYVPGIVKSIFKPTKKSTLNDTQQAMCLKVLLRFSESSKPKLTQAEREDLQKYVDLQPQITKEQDEFLQFAKSKWPERTHTIKCEDFINLCWKAKLEYFYTLPRFYAEITNIPFKADKLVEVKFISDCLQGGEGKEIILPNFEKPYKLHINSEMLRKRYPKKNNYTKSIYWKLPVSEDAHCHKLAESNNVDLVISSSGLNCLVNNIGPKYSNSWILPVTIKRHNDKNVIYIDKPAPPVARTVPEKNSWVYKYILKYYFTCTNDESNGESDDNIFGDNNGDELLALEEQYENTLVKVKSEPPSLIKEEIKSSAVDEKSINADDNSTRNIVRSFSDNMSDVESLSKSVDVPNFNASKKYQGAKNNSSVSYKLFTIGPPQLSEQNELMKNVHKEYKILVRTKSDGYEVVENKLRKLLLLAPKLEHQLDFGAEAVTLEEALRQWISLIFRPDTCLARVRIAAQTAEVLQIEYRTAVSVNNEIKRLFNVKVEDSLVIFHNIIQSLSTFSSGQYIIRHTIRNGAFATVYKPVEGPGKSVLDTHTIYSQGFQTLPNPSWIPLEKTLPTPMQKHFGRMPALFYPSANKTCKNDKKCKGKEKSNTRTNF